MSEISAETILYGTSTRLERNTHSGSKRRIERVSLHDHQQTWTTTFRNSLQARFEMVVCAGDAAGLIVEACLRLDPFDHKLRNLCQVLFSEIISEGINSDQLCAALGRVSLEAEIEQLPAGKARLVDFFPDTIEPFYLSRSD